MNNIISRQNNSFENIKIIKNNSEYWSARDLMKTLDYLRWENFDEVINKAKNACKNSKQDVKEHFRDITKTLITGNKAKINIIDIELDRYACYLIAQNTAIRY